MKLILSPTKTMTPAHSRAAMPRPTFESAARELIRQLSTLDFNGLKALYKASDALIQKSRDQIHGFDDAQAGPALFVFRGEAFKTLDAPSLSPEEISFAAAHVRIFSGLYGILSPLDAVKPYRLDFNTPLKINDQGMKAFWQERINLYFDQLLAPDEPLLNLASQEYASILQPQTLKGRMIQLQFRERAGEKLKNLSVRAKQARGAFAGHIIRRGITDPLALKEEAIDGYGFDPELSTEREWFFIR